MLVAKIDRDYITPDRNDEFNRVGHEFNFADTVPGYREGTKVKVNFSAMKNWSKVRFRCLDDDEEVYFGGWLYNDPDCEVQLEVLRYTMADAGCTIIEVHIDPENGWVREIG